MSHVSDKRKPAKKYYLLLSINWDVISEYSNKGKINREVCEEQPGVLAFVTHPRTGNSLGVVLSSECSVFFRSENFSCQVSFL